MNTQLILPDISRLSLVDPSSTHFHANHAPYEPTNPYVAGIHPAEVNAIQASSILLAQLKERDFFKLGRNAQGEVISSINPKAVIALEYCCEELVKTVCKAGGAMESTNHVAQVDAAMYANLGLTEPALVSLARTATFNPLYAHGTEAQLRRIFYGMQKLARELVAWLVEARRRSVLLGVNCLWKWDDAGFVNYRAMFIGLPSPFQDAPLAPAVLEFTSDGRPSTESREVVLHPVHSIYAQTHPDFNPFAGHTLDNSGHVFDDEAMEVDTQGQVVLHPTASRYARWHNPTTVFAGEELIDNGYVSEGYEA
ncbi:hypothetical protein DFP72DRAFT_855595 [Ephemerocybe angulata]|uniref:Uncharacterized protein n=1 Tax=Ephemerocybe angulata TaxID=980116 RepID=A0A8H6HFM9_9AGAR|nr:hypothetical protein DFP72DRAFT_855595 [Tulosesus angulatus]